MTDVSSQSEAAKSLARALGRIPSGVFILTAEHAGQTAAMLASWVQQASFHPPCISVALAGQRPIAHLIRQSGRLALSIIPAGDKVLMRKYARGVEPASAAEVFADVAIAQAPSGLPVLSDALGWLDCRLRATCSFDADHDLLVAEVSAGHILTDTQPFTHVRGNGMHY